MKNLLLALALFPLTGRAEAPKNPVLNCWDGSFAYNTLQVGDSEDGPHLLRVVFASEDQAKFLKNVRLGEIQGWGQAEVSFYVARKDCRETDPARKDLLSCATKDGILEIAFDQNLETRKILRLEVRSLQLETRIEGKALRASLSFDAGSVGAGSLSQAYRLTDQGVCHGLGH